MKLKNHLLLLSVFIITCTLIFCTSKNVQVKKEVDCSVLLADAKKELVEGKEAIQTTKDAKFEFSDNYQCIFKDKVVFGMNVHITHYDVSVGEFICADLFMEIIAERKQDKINFEFGDAVLKSTEICGSGLVEGVFNQ